MKKYILTTITFCTVLVNLATAQTEVKSKFLDTLRLGIRYQVQEFHTLNQKLKEQENCNCDESLPLSGRALQSISASLYEPLTDRWSVGADLGGSFGTVMNDHRQYTKYSFVQMRVESFYHLFDSKSKLRPYLSGSIQLAANQSKALLSLPLGAGLRYQLLRGGSLHVQTAYDGGLSHAMARNMVTQVGFNVPLFKRKTNNSGLGSYNQGNASTTSGVASANWSAQPKAANASTAANTTSTIAPTNTNASTAPTAASLNAANANNTKTNANQGTSQSSMQSSKQLARIIYFDTDKNSVNKENSSRILAEVYEFLVVNPGTRVYLFGHTDNVQTEAYNMQLSKNRVAAIAAWLSQKGIDSSRIEGKHYGESSPAASNTYSSGRAANRRVEIIVK